MNQVTEEHVFDTFNAQIRTSLTAALKWGDGKLYTSDVQDLDQTYLAGFVRPADRQYHNCSACKSFLRHYGGLLVCNGDETRSALWDFHADSTNIHFSMARQMLKAEVTKARINGVFASKLAMLGQPETNGWTHFWTHNPKVHTHPVLTAGQAMAQPKQDFLTLRRGMAEFKVETFAGVVTLMESEAAYRSPKFEGLAKKYLLLKLKIDSVNQIRRDTALWHAVANGLPPGIRSSALGTLYADLDGGMAAADALRRFAAIVDPRVYQQPTAAPKAGNIKRAEDIFAAMGLERSLERRVATFSEIASRCAWEATGVSAPLRVVETSKKAGIFGALNQSAAGADPIQGVNTKMSLRKFMEQRAQSVEAMQIVGLDRPHSMGTITAAVHTDAPPLFSWHNTYGWYRWFGVTGKDFGLGTEATVLGILDLPSTWFDSAGPHTGLMFVLEGALDQGSVGSGIPAEGLRSELHEVKRTIVAHSLNGKLMTATLQHAAGLIVRKDDFKPFVIRANGVDYAITSWE